MNFIERYDLLVRIAQFIRQEKTGTLEEFAKRCDMENKYIMHRQIEILREFAGRAKAKILYNNDKKTYYFSPRGKFSDFKFIEDI